MAIILLVRHDDLQCTINVCGRDVSMITDCMPMISRSERCFYCS